MRFAVFSFATIFFSRSYVADSLLYAGAGAPYNSSGVIPPRAIPEAPLPGTDEPLGFFAIQLRQVGSSMSQAPILGRLVTMPENQAALRALAEVVRYARSARVRPPFLLLMVHGAPGTGKTCLTTTLCQEIGRQASDVTVAEVSARDLKENIPTPGKTGKRKPGEESPVPEILSAAVREADLLVLEDLQHLPWTLVEFLVELLDERQAHERITIATASVGPAHLTSRGRKFPNRLTSRLSGGLVVALEPWSLASRKQFLQEMAQRRQLPLRRDILDWLAVHLPGNGRQMLGALDQVEALGRMLGPRLDAASVADHFQSQAEARVPTVEKIAEQVGRSFQVKPTELLSARRHRSIVLPRQVGMYLARQLTGLSLERIGAYFGGRDHTTVLHACRKVEKVLLEDAVLSGTVKRLHAELT